MSAAASVSPWDIDPAGAAETLSKAWAEASRAPVVLFGAGGTGRQVLAALRETGVAPDGSRTSADNTITKLSADKLTWESNNRTLDGDPQPGIGRVEINRVKGN